MPTGKRKEIANERLLKQLVEDAGGFVRKAKWVGVNGAPDRFCGFPKHGRSAWVEVKEADQDWGLQAHQEREIGRLRACGQEVRILESEWEVRAFVKEMTR